MIQVEVFFDHSCPYCLRGYEYLIELLPRYPGIEILWRPVEAHPKIEEPEHTPYVDLAVQGQLIIRDMGGDELKYAGHVFKAYFEDRLAPDDISMLAKCAAKAGVDADEFKEALQSRKYEKAGHAANDYAYEQKDVWAVPAFICGDKRLDSIPGVGVTKGQLDAFLASCRV